MKGSLSLELGSEKHKRKMYEFSLNSDNCSTVSVHEPQEECFPQTEGRPSLLDVAALLRCSFVPEERRAKGPLLLL